MRKITDINAYRQERTETPLAVDRLQELKQVLLKRLDEEPSLSASYRYILWCIDTALEAEKPPS